MIGRRSPSLLGCACVLLGALAGCATEAPVAEPRPERAVTPAPQPPEVVGATTLLGWRCEDGTTLQTRYEESGGALVVARIGERFVLAPDRREGRASWSRDSMRLEVDGDVAVFAQAAYELVCRRASDVTSALRAAALGAVFRAQGNEPGWSVDVYPDRLAWVGAWGADRRAFGEVAMSGSSTSVRWNGRAGESHLDLAVRYETCVDDGDREFPARVEVILDGERYVGCGRPLDGPP